MPRILVTGGSGFVGSHCLPPLVKRGYEVHAVSREPQTGGNVTWHQVDLLDAKATRALIDMVRPSHLLHLAWTIVPGEYESSPDNLRWLQASIELLTAFAASGGLRAVLTGTCVEYAASSEPCNECATPLAPTTLYAAAKVALFHLMPALGRLGGEVSTAWARVFHLYGPMEHAGKVVPSVITSLLKGQPVAVTSGRQLRDFLYIEEAGGALAALVDCEVEGAVNIASGRAKEVRDLLRLFGEEIGAPELIRFGELDTPSGEPPVLVADTTRLNGEVGWSPRLSDAEVVKLTVDWWRSQLNG